MPDSLPAFVVVATAVVASLTAVVMWALKGRRIPSHYCSCLITLGLIPFAVYFVLYSAVYPFSMVMRLSPYSFFALFALMSVWVAPNYLVSFIIASPFLIYYGLKRQSIGLHEGVCICLLLVHALGALFVYVMWS
jgi:hypothetical protein